MNIILMIRILSLEMLCSTFFETIIVTSSQGSKSLLSFYLLYVDICFYVKFKVGILSDVKGFLKFYINLFLELALSE